MPLAGNPRSVALQRAPAHPPAQGDRKGAARTGGCRGREGAHACSRRSLAGRHTPGAARRGTRCPATALTLAVSTSASTGRLTAGHHDGRRGPVALARTADPRPLHDQRRPARPDVRGRAHPRRLLPLHRHRPRPEPDGRLLRRPRPGHRHDRLARVLPADPGLVPHQLLRPARLPPRVPDPGLAADAEALRELRHRARRPLRPRLPRARPGHRGGRRPGGGLPRVRPGEHPGHPERGPLRAGHGPVGDLRGQPRGARRRRRPRRQRVLRLQPPGRRLGLLRRDRLPRPPPRERPRLRPARPLHPGGRRRGRPLGHHERGLGRQQRPARLAQVEAGLARRRPDQLRGGARHHRAHPDPAGPAGGTKLAFVPLDGRPGTRSRCAPARATTRRSASPAS